MKRWLPGLGLAALLVAAACTFHPDLSRFPTCDAQGACPAGWTCLASEGICLPDCGESGPCTARPAQLVLIPDGPSDGLETASYFQRFQASGGTPPYTFSTTEGTPPPGLSLNAKGELSGRPTTAGDFRFTVEVVDQGVEPQRSSQEFSVHIRPLLRLAGPVVLADVETGEAYVEQLSAIGGKPPYQFELVPGSTLPSGIVLNPGGRVDGTTDANTTVSFEVRVTDSDEPPQAAVRTLTVTTATCAAPCVRTRSVPDARVGTPYTYTLRTGSLPWTLEDGTLPPGITLDSNTGVLSGTPTKASPTPYSFTVSSSSLLNKQQVQLTLRVY